MTDAEVAACVEVARSRNLRVCCHARSPESVQMALRHGIPIIYHANYADKAALDALEAAKDRVFVAPALGVTHALCYRGEPWGTTYRKAEERGLVRELACGIEVVRALHKRGVRVLPGGDYGFAWTPHGTYARDLEIFVKDAGLLPKDVLIAATKQSGEIMGEGFHVGQVRPGYAADLLLVRGNPLEDITRLQDAANLLMILQGGRFHKAPPPDLARAQQGAA
ncbi:MAG TPA: amidohydrolase family protein, partial [bacterium]